MCYYINISEDAVKIDLYEDYVVDFEIGDYSFTSVVYDTTTSWNLQNNEQ